MKNPIVTLMMFLSPFSFSTLAQEPEVPETPARVGRVSSAQQKRIIERTEVLKLWSFSFGPGGASNMNNDHLMYTFAIGRHWEVNENAEIRANVHTTLPSAGVASYSSFGIGGGWLMSTSDISPLIGAEIGYGYALIPKLPDKSGFNVGAHAGVRLFRTAKAQMAVEAYAKTLLVSGERPQDYGMALSVLY